MSAVFKSKKISIRERLISLLNHRHDTLYEKKGSFIGNNLLINGAKEISQRGDFSTPFTPNNAQHYVDSYYTGFSPADITVDYSHNEFDTDINTGNIIVQVIATNGTSSSGFSNKNKLYNAGFLLDKVITYTAWVKSNTNTTISIVENLLNHFESSPHSGSGKFELLTVTHKITSVNLGVIDFSVNMVPIGEGTTLGDTITIGNEKVEQGDKFTGFKYESKEDVLLRCRQIMLPITSEYATDVIGTFIGFSTTRALCTKMIPAMIGDWSDFAVVDGSSSPPIMIGPGTYTNLSNFITISSSSNFNLGKLVLTIEGIGLVVNEVNILQKNSYSGIIYIQRVI